MNWVNSNNFITRTLRFSEKFGHPFSNVYIFGNMFPESHGFVAMPVTSSIEDTWSNLSLSNQWRETKLLELVTSTGTKPWLSGNMFLNINPFNKIFPVNSIPITKSINLLLFCKVLVSWCRHFYTNCPCTVQAFYSSRPGVDKVEFD